MRLLYSKINFLFCGYWKPTGQFFLCFWIGRLYRLARETGARCCHGCTPRHRTARFIWRRCVLEGDVAARLAAIEAELVELDAAERQEYLQELGFEEPGLNRVIRAGYKLLGLQTYFTAGEKEVRAWTVHIGATAPQAAGVIHTDFERGFIRAETVSYDDFVACNGEHGAREAGKLRSEGKDYVVHDGDVMHFRFNV